MRERRHGYLGQSGPGRRNRNTKNLWQERTSVSGGRRRGDVLGRVGRRRDEGECMSTSGEHLQGFWLRVRGIAVVGVGDEK